MSTVRLDELAAVPRRFAVGGMTCASCVRHVESALGAVPGVRSARVDLASGTATVLGDPATASPERLRAAVAAAGYALEPLDLPSGAPGVPGGAPPARLPTRPIVFGVLAALGLVAFYLGMITLAQGWQHASQQLAEDRFFVGAIALGFAIQAGLFAYLRGLTHLRGRQARASAGGVAASTGTSTTAMLACCAHHLTEVLPILGLSGAAVFLNAYKTPLLWVGIGMNLVGIVYLTSQVRRQSRMACHRPAAEPRSA